MSKTASIILIVAIIAAATAAVFVINSADDPELPLTAEEKDPSLVADRQEKTPADGKEGVPSSDSSKRAERLADCEKQLALSDKHKEAPSDDAMEKCLAEADLPPDKNPYYSIVPIQLFRLAGLGKNNSNKMYDDLEEVRPDIFVEGSVSLGVQERFVALLAKELIDTCLRPNPDTHLEVEVFGFASDEPFLTHTGAERKDSELLNLAAANLRGKAVYEALMAAKERSPDGANMSIRHHEWKYSEGDPRCEQEGSVDKVEEALCKMREKRTKIFSNFQIAQGEHTNHRSAIIRMSNPEKCSLFYPYQK